MRFAARIIFPWLQERLATEVADWRGFADKAREDLALPLVQRSLPTFGSRVPAAVRAEIELAYNASAAQNLRLAATLIAPLPEDAS